MGAGEGAVCVGGCSGFGDISLALGLVIQKKVSSRSWQASQGDDGTVLRLLSQSLQEGHVHLKCWV